MFLNELNMITGEESHLHIVKTREIPKKFVNIIICKPKIWEKSNFSNGREKFMCFGVRTVKGGEFKLEKCKF
jgi:hypothetical protein